MKGMIIMKKINKLRVLKQVRENKAAKFYISPNNVNSFHINNGWNLGHEILISYENENKKYFVEYNGEKVELESYLNNFKYYNCNSELGYKVSFWENEK